MPTDRRPRMISRALDRESTVFMSSSPPGRVDSVRWCGVAKRRPQWALFSGVCQQLNLVRIDICRETKSYASVRSRAEKCWKLRKVINCGHSAGTLQA